MNDPKWHRKTAIHEFCMECMGGREWVGWKAAKMAARKCPATSCPLWHFRPGAGGCTDDEPEAILEPDDAREVDHADQGEAAS